MNTEILSGVLLALAEKVARGHEQLCGMLSGGAYSGELQEAEEQLRKLAEALGGGE